MPDRAYRCASTGQAEPSSGQQAAPEVTIAEDLPELKPRDDEGQAGNSSWGGARRSFGGYSGGRGGSGGGRGGGGGRSSRGRGGSWSGRGR
jgi:hypothetical protein